MVAIHIPLDGKITEVQRIKIPLKKMILDIENPRIQYYLDTRLNDTIKQDHIEFALRTSNDMYEKLRDNIEQNRGIYNPVWVVNEGDYYRVIEGNTRVLIYKELSEKYFNDENWKSIDSYVLPIAVERYKINFIRLEAHLFGTTPWDAYEKARELHRLHKEEDYPLKRLQQLTKLSAYDIKNNIQAFMDMQEQYFPHYYSPGEQFKFSYFAEFRKNKSLKKLFQNGEITLQQFCDLVGHGKFGRGEHVRKLAMVWEDEQAREALIDENMDAALEQLSQKNPAAKSKLFEKIKDVTLGLEHMSWGEYDQIKCGFQPAKVDEMIKLHNVLSKILSDIGAIQ